MLIIHFKQSKSKRYKEAIRLALFFSGYRQEGNMNVLDLKLKEIIEKWEWFNELYWLVLDWRGTTVEYENVIYHTHSDKTKLFYAVQEIHTNWINYTTSSMVTKYQRIPAAKSKLLDIDPEELSNDELNHLIDVMMEKKRANDAYLIQMKEVEKMIHS